MDYMTYNVTEGHIVHKVGGGERMEREQTTIRLPAELKEQLQQEADKLGISFNGLVVSFIRKGLGLE